MLKNNDLHTRINGLKSCDGIVKPIVIKCKNKYPQLRTPFIIIEI